MELMLTVTNPPASDPTFAASHRFKQAGGAIGRGANCTWQLPDASRRLSNQHAQIGFEDGAFFIEDLSTNGLFVNHASTALGKGNRHVIRDADEFMMGPFLLRAHLWAQPEEQSSLPASIASFFDELESAPTGAGHRELADQLAITPPEKVSSQLPAEDELERELEALAWALDAVDVPNLVVPHAAAKRERQTQVLDFQQESPVAQAPAKQASSFDPQTDRITQPAQPRRTAQSDQEALREFLRALGLNRDSIPEGALEPLLQGCAQLLRGSLKAVMELLAVRTEQKNRYHLGLTLIQRQENNPLKYCVNELQAIKQLLVDPQPECLPAAQALAQATSDLVGHSQAMEAAYQDLIREVVQFVAGEEMAEEAEAARRGWMDRRAQKRALQKRLTTLCDEEVLRREFVEHRFAKLYQGALSSTETHGEGGR